MEKGILAEQTLKELPFISILQLMENEAADAEHLDKHLKAQKSER